MIFALAGLAISLSVSTIFLYLAYRQDIIVMENKLEDLGRLNSSEIARGLWLTDEFHVKLIIDGFLQIEDICYAEISGPELTEKISAGRQQGNELSRAFPLTYNYNDKEHELGTLYIEASREHATNRLRDDIPKVMARVFISVFLISLLVYYLVHSLLLRHLSSISSQLKAPGFFLSDDRLKLGRQRQANMKDELDELVVAVNQLKHDLGSANRQLRQAKAELEADLARRLEAEKALQIALDEIKTLRGVIPICSYCKQIRDEEGVWRQLEMYIHKHSEAEFTHGVCPGCYEKVMAELDQ